MFSAHRSSAFVATEPAIGGSSPRSWEGRVPPGRRVASRRENPTGAHSKPPSPQWPPSPRIGRGVTRRVPFGRMRQGEGHTATSSVPPCHAPPTPIGFSYGVAVQDRDRIMSEGRTGADRPAAVPRRGRTRRDRRAPRHGATIGKTPSPGPMGASTPNAKRIATRHRYRASSRRMRPGLSLAWRRGSRPKGSSKNNLFVYSA